jgi:hypothetical protein
VSAGLQGRPQKAEGGCWFGGGTVLGGGVVDVIRLLRGAVSLEEAHIVDLSGDWWRFVEGEGGGWRDFEEGLGDGIGSDVTSASCWSSSMGSSLLVAVEFDDVLLRSVAGGVSGSTKSVWRESSQRTTSGGQDGPWRGRAWAVLLLSKRERKAREPREQNV